MFLNVYITFPNTIMLYFTYWSFNQINMIFPIISHLLSSSFLMSNLRIDSPNLGNLNNNVQILYEIRQMLIVY